MLTRVESGPVPGDFSVLVIGDLNENKNHCVLVGAVAQFPDVRLLIASGRSLHGGLEAPAEWLRVSGHVCLLGFRYDVAAFLNACNPFCLSSGRKGLPVSLTGVMVTGVPVLASDACGYADVLIIRNRDAGAWAERIAAVAENGVLATLSELRTGVAVFGVVLAVSALARVYEETLTGREAA